MKSKREQFLQLQKIHRSQELARQKKETRQGLYPSSLSLPIGVQFELTSECNLFCKHCYNKSFMGRKSSMKIEDWKIVARDIVDNGGVFQCILSGGEPLLVGKELFDVMEPLHADGTSFILITNGYLVDKEWVKKIKKYDYYWVQVSIDHLIPEYHDSFRGKKGSWERARQAAFLFSSAGLPLRIAHSVTPDSLQFLEEFAEFCFLLGASSLICGEIMFSGRAADNANLYMKHDDYEIFYSTVERVKRKYAGKMDILVSSSESIEMRQRQKTLNTSVVIRPNGDVRLDCTMPFTIGNVLQKKFSEIWRDKGNGCWKHPLVDKYIAEIENKGVNLSHINHVDADIEI